MLKLIGAMLLLSAGTASGLTASASLARRTARLTDGIVFLDELRAAMEFTLLPLDALFDSLSKRPSLKRLDFIKLGDTDSAFNERWSTALNASSMPYNERVIYLALSEALGTTGLDGQLGSIALARKRLENELAVAQQEKSKSRLYVSLGALSGAAAAVLLL